MWSGSTPWAATYDQSKLQRWYFDPVHAAMLDLIERVEPVKSAASILDIFGLRNGPPVARDLGALALRASVRS